MDLKEARLIPRGGNLKDGSVYALYKLLTGDDINKRDKPLWNKFVTHTDRRNKAVHSRYLATEKEVEESLATVSTLINLIETTVLPSSPSTQRLH